MANRVKTISKYSGSAWGTEVPIGADATNVDMTSNPSDYDSSSSETSKTLIGTNDVKVISSDTDLTAWGKFNRFRRRVSNKFADYFATTNLVTSTTGVTTSGTDGEAYTAKALNDYFANVIGYSSESDLPSSADTVASQLSSLNSKMNGVTDWGNSVHSIQYWRFGGVGSGGTWYDSQWVGISRFKINDYLLAGFVAIEAGPFAAGLTHCRAQYSAGNGPWLWAMFPYASGDIYSTLKYSGSYDDFYLEHSGSAVLCFRMSCIWKYPNF
jgi:hypothetical protein